MGYETAYSLGISGTGPLYDDFAGKIDTIKVNDDYGFTVSDLMYGNTERMKWYDWEKDMVALSKQWSNVLFTLNGEGEESGDIWRAWFRNGHVVVSQAQIVFEEPDLDEALPLDNEAEIAARALKKDRLQERIARLTKELESLEEE